MFPAGTTMCPVGTTMCPVGSCQKSIGSTFGRSLAGNASPAMPTGRLRKVEVAQLEPGCSSLVESQGSGWSKVSHLVTCVNGVLRLAVVMRMCRDMTCYVKVYG